MEWEKIKKLSGCKTYVYIYIPKEKEVKTKVQI